jgi:hypothetical protein
MRTTEMLGKTITLTEKEWSQLVGRFDVDRVKEAKDTYAIPRACFCGWFPCRRCPLSVARWGDLGGCIRLLNHLTGTREWAFVLSTDTVWWMKDDDEKARKQIQKVYDALQNMEWVEK